jgi:hypothetical protein
MSDRINETLSLISEIHDLQELLRGLPDDMQDGPFTRVYEQRLGTLQRRLEVLQKELAAGRTGR